MKLILSAYACNPEKGSEPGVGWNWLKEIAKYNEVFVLFYAGQRQKEAVEKAIDLLYYKNNIHIIPIEVPSLFQKRLYRIRYEIWQIKSYFTAKRIVKEEKIDLIHHVTIAAWWFTGYYYNLNIPLVFGPILGGQKSNEFLLKYLPFRNRLYELMRNFFLDKFVTFNFKTSKTIKKARIILCGNNETRILVKKFGADKVEIMTSSGINNIL